MNQDDRIFAPRDYGRIVLLTVLNIVLAALTLGIVWLMIITYDAPGTQWFAIPLYAVFPVIGYFVAIVALTAWLVNLPLLWLITLPGQFILYLLIVPITAWIGQAWSMSVILLVIVLIPQAMGLLVRMILQHWHKKISLLEENG